MLVIKLILRPQSTCTFVMSHMTVGGLDLELPPTLEDMFAGNAWYSTTTFSTFVNVPLPMTNETLKLRLVCLQKG